MPKVVGVIGGLGPEATLDFFAKLLERTPATSDQEHIHLLINNNPQVPNRNEAVAGTGPSAGPALAQSAQALERAGAEVLVMVCNAAHAFEADIRAATALPFLSIIDVTAQAAYAALPKLKTVGLLGSSGCLDAELYQHAFASYGVKTLQPSGTHRDSFMHLLYRIKAGDKSKELRDEMKWLAQDLINQGAEALIAACTEVPLVLKANDLSAPLINSTDCLVEATVAYALEPTQKPMRPTTMRPTTA